MLSYELSLPIARGAFIFGVFTNLILIYFTTFFSRTIKGTYKTMVLTFATLGILLASWEQVSVPFLHTYNKSFIYFSLNTWSGVPQVFLQLGIAFYASVYMFIMAFLTIQFVYRYCTLFQPRLSEKFDGKGAVIWLGYPLVPAILYGGSICVSCQPDEYSDAYLREVISQVYSRKIEDLPRFGMVPFAADGSLRSSILFHIVGIILVVSHYFIILFFGLYMYFHLKKKMDSFSAQNKKIQVQFFWALVAQTLIPTFLFIVPIAPVLLLPVIARFVDLRINFSSGWALTLFSFYPPMDSIAFMWIVTEYRNIFKNAMVRIVSKNRSQVTPLDN